MNSGTNQAILEERAVELADLQAIGPALVIAPHPDDESLGCGGTVAQLRALGYSVHVLFVSDGTMSHPNSRDYPADRLRNLRESEAREAICILGLHTDDCLFLRYKDRQVPMQGQLGFLEAATSVATLIDEFKPATIFVPWRRDPHPDHRATWQIMQEALRQTTTKPKVLEYLIWLWELGNQEDMPGADEVIVWKVPIDAVINQRDRAIAAHRSQVTRLIDDDPTAFYLSPELLTHFDKPRELFLETKPLN